MELTKSLEEYVISIYILEEKKEKIRVTDIATEMLVTKPSVNRALKTLREKGIICFEPYKDITLTEEGREIAQNRLKKYDIVKIFLTEILGVDNKTAEEDSLKIKAAISEKTEEQLEKYMTKTLNLDKLKCNHSWERKQCRKCKRIYTYVTKKNHKEEEKC